METIDKDEAYINLVGGVIRQALDDYISDDEIIEKYKKIINNRNIKYSNRQPYKYKLLQHDTAKAFLFGDQMDKWLEMCNLNNGGFFRYCARMGGRSAWETYKLI